MESYKFKRTEAEKVLCQYLSVHPESLEAAKALCGDPAAMLSVYNEMAKVEEEDGGPTLEALYVLEEASGQNYTPAMVEMATLNTCFCKDDGGWPCALNLLYKALQLGDVEAGGDLANNWHNIVKEWDGCEYQDSHGLNKNQEYALGFYYLRGICVERDDNKARAYLQKSAAHGCWDAKSLLEECAS